MNDVPTHTPPGWPAELTTSPSTRGALALTDVIGGIVLVAVLAAAVAVFAHPWRDQGTSVSRSLAKYAPARDGLSLLAEVRDGRGGLLSHRSINLARFTPANVFLQLPTDVQVAVNMGVATTPDAARRGEIDADAAAPIGLGELERAVVLDQRTTDVQPNGTISRTGAVIVDAAAGRMQASLEFGDGFVIPITPPALLLPADLSPDSDPWRSVGTFGVQPFSYEGRVVGRGPRQTAIGDFDDCIDVEDEFVAGPEGDETRIDTRTTYCAGVGLVEREDETTQGGGLPVTEVSRVISTNARSLPAAASVEPSAGPVSNGDDIGDPDDWTLSRFGRTVPTGISAGATGAARFIPSTPGQLLVTDETGDLVAFDASSSIELWRFNLGGPALGLVGYDEGSRTVLVGSSDHRVYALDDRGLFKWAFETSDNVASRPVVADSVVVVGGEDGNVYGIELASGTQRWLVETSAAVASSPAVANGVVAIGNDDGTLLGLDPATGQQRWSIDLPGYAEGPVATDGVAFLVGSSGVNNLGAVTAIDSSSGDVRWSTPMPNVVRTEVAVGERLVFVIDEGGILTALDKATGEQRWQTRSLYVGPPVAVGDLAAAAQQDGRVDLFDAGGTVTRGFSSAAAQSPVDEPPDLHYGLSQGGGAIWMADTNAVVYRLGPPTNDIEALDLTWVQGLNKGSGGLPGGPLTVTPAVSGDQVVVVDGLGGISVMDSASGDARRVGNVDVGDEVVHADPVVVDDLVVTAVGSELVATDLNTGARAWRVDGDSGSATVAPLAVGRGLVVWVQGGSKPDPVTGSTSGTLRVIDPATGAERWKVRTSGGFGASAVVVDDVVVASSPPTAFDLLSGSVRWTAAGVPGNAFAATTVDPESATVIVPMLAPTDNAVTLFALDADSGRTRWQRALPGGERPSVTGRSVVNSGTLVVQTAAELVGIDVATGLEQWRFAPTGPMFGGIEAANGFVYVVTSRATVSAIDVRTGELRARASDVEVPLSAQGPTFVHPIAVDGTLIVPLATFVIGVELLR